MTPRSLVVATLLALIVMPAGASTWVSWTEHQFAINQWLPSDWWVPRSIARGDLNGDLSEDVAVVIERPDDAPDDPTWPKGSRGLLILFGVPALETYEYVTLAPGVLPCRNCIGGLTSALTAAVLDVSIEDGLLSVEWIDAAADKAADITAVMLVFRYDAESDQIRLIKDRTITRDTKRGIETRLERDYLGGTMLLNGELHPLDTKPPAIESVLASDY